MKAVIITRSGGPEVLEVQDRENPKAIADYVLVRVHAAGLNRADLSQRMGLYPAPAGSPQDIPGLEFAGEVEAIGDQVTRWKPGRRVMGIAGGGAQAEYILTHEGLLVEIPENLDYVQAAAIPEVFMTAHDALFTQGGLQMGERVLVHAAGSGVGTAAIQLAHNIGCQTFGSSRTPEKLEQAKALGLDVPVVAAKFDDEVLEVTGGEGVHIILDFIGAAYMEQNLKALTTWGRLIFLSTMGGAQARINMSLMMVKRIQIRGCTLRSRSLEEKLAVTRRFATQVLPLFARGDLVPVVQEALPLAEVGKAHGILSQNSNFGKVVLTL